MNIKSKYIPVLSLAASLSLPAGAQNTGLVADTTKFADQTIDLGTSKTFKRSESTSAVSIITSKTTDRRSAKNIANSILGQGTGLISLDGTGNYASKNPTFYVRGLQSISGSSPLVVVDGIERSIDYVTPTEVESVSILKDAAAVALYGYRGSNGVILITTKRGTYDSRSIKFTFDHGIDYMTNRPKFVDAATYASAVNEARGYEGLDAQYSQDAINAYRDGSYPYLYPNVNWVDETFRHHAITNKYNIEFSGGGKKFRYYTMIDLNTNKGFIKSPNENDGYSTQDKYVKGSVRTNLDIDLTPTTLVKANLMGVLMEHSQPGKSVNLWNMVYSVPALAFPIKAENGYWGGNATWAGTSNPVGQSQGAAYAKDHTRGLFSDLTIKQDLKYWLPGLGATAKVAYDNFSNIYEDHSQTYIYGMDIAGDWVDGKPTVASSYKNGTKSDMGTGASTNSYNQRFHFSAGLNYDRTFGKHAVYTELKYDYDYNEYQSNNNTYYRQDISWWTHYGFDNRYLADLALVESGSSRLAPGTKWSFSPTLSLAWNISNEKFMKNVSWVNFLKLRASAGIINADFLPENTWTYWTQQYNSSGVSYPFTKSYGSDFGMYEIGQLATENPSHEKAYKYNVGLDGTLFGGLDFSLEGYYQHRTDIWVDASGKYTSVLGVAAPYENAGVVNGWGIEGSLDYNKKIGEVTCNVGGSVSYNRNKIKEQLEEPRAFKNLVKTGDEIGQLYGLKAIGYFKDATDIANSPTQTFSTEVFPGDVKYEDVNGDNIIDGNDVVAIGHSTCPALYYNFHLGAEWKGLGFYAAFQGTGRYSGLLNDVTGMYKPLVNNANLSQYYYDNRWTPENQNARFPRLCSQTYANNYQNSTLWLVDRSYLKLRNIEVYYNFPKSLLEHTKIVNAAKLYVRGTDLFCWDHLDNADAASYGATSPLTRSVIFGLSVTF